MKWLLCVLFVFGSQVLFARNSSEGVLLPASLAGDPCAEILSYDGRTLIDNVSVFQRVLRQCRSWREELGCESEDQDRADSCNQRVFEVFSAEPENYRRSRQGFSYGGVLEEPSSGAEAALPTSTPSVTSTASESAAPSATTTTTSSPATDSPAIPISAAQSTCQTYFAEHSGHANLDFSSICNGLRARLDRLGRLGDDESGKDEAFLAILNEAKEKMEQGLSDTYFNFFDDESEPRFRRELQQSLDHLVLSELRGPRRTACEVGPGANGRMVFNSYRVTPARLEELQLSSDERAQLSSGGYLAPATRSLPNRSVLNGNSVRYRENFVRNIRNSLNPRREENCDYVLGSAFYGGQVACSFRFDGQNSSRSRGSAINIENGVEFRVGEYSIAEESSGLGMSDLQALHQDLIDAGVCREDRSRMAKWCVVNDGGLGNSQGGHINYLYRLMPDTTTGVTSFDQLGGPYRVYSRQAQGLGGESIEDKLASLCESARTNCPLGLRIPRTVYSRSEAISANLNIGDSTLSYKDLQGRELTTFCGSFVRSRSSSGSIRRSSRGRSE